MELTPSRGNVASNTEMDLKMEGVAAVFFFCLHKVSFAHPLL